MLHVFDDVKVVAAIIADARGAAKMAAVVPGVTVKVGLYIGLQKRP